MIGAIVNLGKVLGRSSVVHPNVSVVIELVFENGEIVLWIDGLAPGKKADKNMKDNEGSIFHANGDFWLQSNVMKMR